jgi:hypothetical protein
VLKDAIDRHAIVTAPERRLTLSPSVVETPDDETVVEVCNGFRLSDSANEFAVMRSGRSTARKQGWDIPSYTPRRCRDTLSVEPVRLIADLRLGWSFRWNVKPTNT